MRLSHPALAGLSRFLAENGVRIAAPLLPTVLIRYRRRRFVDPASGARVNLDTEIVLDRVNPQFMHPRPPLRIKAAVCEIKGRSGELPRGLAPIVTLGGRRSAFSKYGEFVRRAADPYANAN